MVTKPTPTHNPATRVNDSLTQLEALGQAEMDSAGAPTYIVQDGKFIYVSSLFQELSGYTDEELLGTCFLNYVHPEDRRVAKKKQMERAKGQPSPPTCEYRFVTKHGDVMRVLEWPPSREYRGRPTALGSLIETPESRRTKKKENQLDHDLAFLSRTATELLQLPPEEDFYQFVAERLAELAGGSVIAINSFDARSERFCLHALLGVGEHIDSVSKMIGRHPVGMHAPINDEARAGLTSGKLEKVPGGLYELLVGSMPRAACRAIEKLLGLNTIYAIGFSWKGRLFGSATILTHKRTQLRNPRLIETFISQASVALQRRQMEEALAESEQTYRELVEASSDMIFTVDTKGNFLFTNKAFHKHLGYSGEEIKEINGFELVHPEDLGAVTGQFGRLLEGESVEAMEYRYQTKEGSYINILNNASPVLDSQGNMVALLGIAKNITERKRAEEELEKYRDHLEELVKERTADLETANKQLQLELRERRRTEKALGQSEERYRTILQEMQDSYFEVDLAGNFTFFNDITCRALGYSRGELTGMNYRVYVAPEDVKLVSKTFNQVYRTGKLGRILVFKFVRKDGSTGYCELWVSPLRNEAGEIVGFRGVNRDITERKQMEEQRKELEQKAHLASHLAAVGEIASGIAHEINNPLTGVIGYAQLLTRKDIPEDIRKDLENISEGSKRVASIVNRMLTFARQYKPAREPVHMNELIKDTIALRAYQLETSDIKVTTQLAPDLPRTVADRGQLQQVFLNLVINAETEMKLTHGRGNLSIRTEKIDNTIKISFGDDGPGVVEENLERIFDPFFSTRQVGEGTGLGLSVCHGIIAEHKGRIYADSQSGKGATFIVELPILTEDKQLESAAPAADESEKLAGARILVVDDEPVILSFLSRVLSDEGYEVETVDNASDALERIKSERYSLILLDIKLPGMSGVELYEHIQKIAKSLARRVIFITGDVMGARTTAFLSQAKAHYITKPFDIEQLTSDINRILAQGS